MSSIRFSFMLLAAVQALSACANHPDATAPTGPAVAMPQLDAAIANSTPEEARRAISNKTWLWTRGGGPYQVHYSTADGRDFAWLVGESRILRGEWRIDTTTRPQGGPLVQLCLRYPGVRRPDLSSDSSCPPAGTASQQIADRESPEPLHP